MKVKSLYYRKCPNSETEESSKKITLVKWAYLCAKPILRPKALVEVFFDHALDK